MHDTDGTRQQRTTRHWRGSPGVSIIGALMLIVLSVMLWMALSRDADAAPPVGATAQQIVDAPVSYEGRDVTVSGEIRQVLGPRSFTIGGGEFVGGGELLIVSATPLPRVINRPRAAMVATDDIVQITGRVQRFEIVAYEAAIRTQLRRDVLAWFEDQPALLGRSLLITPRAEQTAHDPAARLAGPATRGAGRGAR